jgi:Sulfotransferase domain
MISTENLATHSSARPPCWGIGLGRTGTTSLCEALRILGYVAVKHNPRFEVLPSLEAGADNGVTVFYKYLDYKFPGSKFVLTQRKLSEWLPSIEDVALRRPVLSRADDVAIQRRMMLYESVTFDTAKFTAGYHRHHADVRRYFADRPGDLLEMNIIEGDGWEKLCPFLGLPLPDQAFPHFNQRKPHRLPRTETVQP